MIPFDEGHDGKSFRQLKEEFVTLLAGKLDVDLLEIRARDVSPPGLNPSARKIAVLLPLPGSAEELWEKGFRSKYSHFVPGQRAGHCRMSWSRRSEDVL